MNWSPAIAGKRGRCKCGATVQIPARLETPAESDTGDDLLSALEIPIRPIEQPTQYAHQPVLAAPLAYATPAPRAASAAALPELAREFYIPAVVLVVGFGSILGWLAHHGRFVFAAVVIVMFLAGLLMIGKTVALSLFAWFLARNNGGSFGHPLGTILKIAGLVVTLDAATLWALSGMVATGAITRRGGFYPIHTIILLFLVTFVVALLIAHIVYRLDEDEAKLFGRFIAGGNLAINVVLVFILVVIGQNAANARRARAAAVASASSANSPASTLPSSGIIETAADRRIESRLSKGAMFIKDPQEWETSIAYGRKNIPVSNLLDQLSVAGASRIYVDTAPARAGITRIYVDLPETPAQRDACFAVAAEWTQNNPKTIVTPQPPTTARFMQIDILR
jgi:hypothetical protein